MFRKIKKHLPLLIFLLAFFTFEKTSAQTELQPWGNIEGIRIEGELMPVHSTLTVVKNNGSVVMSTARERQRPTYERARIAQVVTTKMDSLYLTEKVADKGLGTATVNVKVVAHDTETMNGLFFTLFLEGVTYGHGSIRADRLKPIQLSKSQNELNRYLAKPAKTFRFVSKNRQLNVTFPQPVALQIKSAERGGNKGWRVFVPVEAGNMQKGDSAAISFVINAGGTIDRSPVTLTLDTSKTGRRFDGLGGNFRLQNPRTDPEVIDYCLKHLNVRWGRVELPWRQWQPALNEDPVAEAKAGHLNEHVKASMEMAARLSKMGIPVILSAWFPPDWAVVGKVNFRPVNGTWGNPLDHTKDQQIYKSIADYILYLKENYGADVKLFSFNESDLGIDIRQTAEEHLDLIKGLGAYFVSRGLTTKMVLGDNSDATSYRFIDPALEDTTSYRYIGAVSFHSWRGWDEHTLQQWADAARRLHKPLIVAEGSIDAQAWGYPQIFLEPMYALSEINLYIRLLSICQPEAILQWQLTSDYSLLAGGGIFGDTTQLRPTQRFWNLKQLSETPGGLKSMKLDVDAGGITAAALGDERENAFAIHIVNNGATRPAMVKGIPKNVRSLRWYMTDRDHKAKEEKRVPVVNGTAKFTLHKTSFNSLFTE